MPKLCGRGKGGWRRMSDPRVLLQAGVSLPSTIDPEKSKTRRAAKQEAARADAERRRLIHEQCMANYHAKKERKRLRLEAYEKKHGAKLDESIEDEVARFRKARADGLFNRLFYPTNGPCPF